MKKLILSIMLLVGIANFSGIEASNINVSVNIGVQPAWGPVGYDYAPYYYMPDINVYYNVDRQIFYYPNNGRWISSRYLPAMYRHYDLYGLYKVVLTDSRPWLYNQHHVVHYRPYRGRKPQPMIRYSNDRRYVNSRNNDVRWYNDNRSNNHNNRNNNNGRSVAGNNRDHNNNNTRSSNARPDNRQTQKSTNNRSENRKPDTRSANVTNNRSSNNSQQRQSNDRNSSRSSSSTRSSSGRTSSGGR